MSIVPSILVIVIIVNNYDNYCYDKYVFSYFVQMLVIKQGTYAK